MKAFLLLLFILPALSWADSRIITRWLGLTCGNCRDYNSVGCPVRRQISFEVGRGHWYLATVEHASPGSITLSNPKKLLSSNPLRYGRLIAPKLGRTDLSQGFCKLAFGRQFNSNVSHGSLRSGEASNDGSKYVDRIDCFEGERTGNGAFVRDFNGSHCPENRPNPNRVNADGRNAAPKKNAIRRSSTPVSSAQKK